MKDYARNVPGVERGVVSRADFSRAVLGLPERDDGLFNIPPHFPSFLASPAAAAVLPSPIVVPPVFLFAVDVVPRKRSRSMRKLPRQELLTINYSSRYPLASPFRALSTVTHANDGRARGLRTLRAGTRHLLTVTPGISGNEREKASWVPIPEERGETRARRELPRIYILLRAPETDCRLLRARIFIRFLFTDVVRRERVLAEPYHSYCHSSRARTTLDLRDVRSAVPKQNRESK